MSYASTILADAPSAYYRLGELSGATANDATANGYNGTINGGVTLGVAGALTNDPSKAMSFDGSTGYVACPVGLSTTGATALTIEFWLNIPTTNYSGDGRIIANSHTDADNKGFQIYVNHFTHTPLLVDFQVGNGAAKLGVETVGPPTMVVGNWYHFVFVYDTVGIRAYVNGALNNSTSSASFGALTASGSPINFGRNPAYSGDYFQGELDEIAIYKNIALSATQANTHYNARTAYPNTQTLFGNHRAFGRVQ